jgi:hypothetical protein
MASIGAIFSLVLLAIGIFLLTSNRRGGIFVTILGGSFILFWLLMIPLARHWGKI